jgi:energy-converting hydrogenase Eha subunit A
MQAELATLQHPGERRRFAIGCTRAALLPTAGMRTAARSCATIGAAILVLACELGAARTMGQPIPLVAVLALLVWLGRRPGYFGPVRPDRLARGLRAGGCAATGLCVLALVATDGPLASVRLVQSDSPRWGALFALVVTLFTGLCLAATTRQALCDGASLAAGALAGLAAGAAAFVVLPFERIGEPLAAGLPARGAYLTAVVFGAPAVAALMTGLRTRMGDQAVMAALCAGAVAALLAAVAGLSAIVLFPGHVPDIVGPVMPPGTPVAAQHAANATEASDPYFGLLVFGGMLLALLWLLARPPIRAATTVALLCLFSLPPIALAGTARDFPGSRAIATATIAVVIGAVFTARPAHARAAADPDDAALT